MTDQQNPHTRDIETQTNRHPRQVSLEDAIFAHDTDGIAAASARGETLPEDTDAVMLVARGICPRELDDQYHQSPRSITGALCAMKDAGIDLNDIRDGVPAAHRLTAYYGKQIIDNYHDTSYRAEIGMSNQSQGECLAAFAACGVDFEIRDMDAKRPLQALKETAARIADEHRENPLDLYHHIAREYAQVRNASRSFKTRNAAEARG